MKKRLLFLTAAASVALVGCTNDNFVGITDIETPEEQVAIDFGSNTQAKTRADHATSAELLGGKFYIYGQKTTAGTTSTIFDNYLLEYAEGTAGSTESNTADWEYVGKNSLKGAYQDIKYWDYSASEYNFVAVSGLGANETIKNTEDGMRIEVTDVNALTSIYVADRITATPTAKVATATTPATVPYNQTVTFKFRRLGAQMRIGFYETVPGYAIKDLIFYYIGAPSGSRTVGVGAAFPTSGKFTVTYDDATNAAVTSFAGATNKLAFSNTFGKLDYTSVSADKAGQASKYIAADGSISDTKDLAFIGSSASEATFAKGTYTIDGTSGVTSYYKPILPYEQNSLKMQMRVDYTLVALDGSGEEIHVRDAYVSVPAEYLKWKPNYSYTYIFKISDRSNGYTGEGGGGTVTDGDGRDPDPDNGGGDNDPSDVDGDGEIDPPYVPDPNYPNPYIDDPDSDDPNDVIPNPDAPLVPNPDYPDQPDAPNGDQGDPSNPVPTPEDPNNPGNPDPENPAELFPITFDAIVIDAVEENQETITEVATPSITTYSATSDVINNNEYKVGEEIIITAEDGVIPTAWDYILSAEEITEAKAASKYATATWISLGTSLKATLTPTEEGYYIIRLTTGSGTAYKVIKVIS